MGRIRTIFRPFIVANILLVATTLVVCWWGSQEVIALYGAGLELVAIGTVLVGLRGTLNVFAPGQLCADTRSWWAAVTSWGAPPPVSGALGAMEIGLDDFSGHGSSGLAAGGTLQQQLESLRERVNALDIVLATTRGELAGEVRERARVLGAERAAREEAIHQLRSDVKEVTVGNPWTTLLGLVLLATGVVLSGAAPFIGRP